jgi:hypothetical protein
MLRRIPAVVLAAALGLIVLSAVAGASSTFSSKVKLVSATQPDSNHTTFTMKVKSDAPKCANSRDVKFSERDAGTSDPFVKVAQGTTDDTGKVTKTIDTKGFPDVKVTALKKTFGPSGHRKTCTTASIVLTHS